MAVVSTGFFDGVHLGHRLVVDTLTARARAAGTESVIVTFWPHPRTVLQQDARQLRLLSSIAEKKELLSAAGVDRLEVLDFNRSFSAMSASQYIREVLVNRFGASVLVLGYDNHLGSDNLCGEDLVCAARREGVDVVLCPPLEKIGGATVSSTVIRSALSQGDVALAAKMLGREYALDGVVVAGQALGRGIGFPTANVKLYDPLKVVPARGVYAVRVYVQGRVYPGMTNIGVRPTVSNGDAVTIETHIIDFDEDIYGLDMKIVFLERLRDEKKFASLDELKAQLGEDRKNCYLYRI